MKKLIVIITLVISMSIITVCYTSYAEEISSESIETSYYDTLSSETELLFYEDVLMSLKSIASGEDGWVDTEIDISANTERFKDVAIYAYYDHPEYSVYIDNFKCEYTSNRFRVVGNNSTININDVVESIAIQFQGKTVEESVRNVYEYLAGSVDYDNNYGIHYDDDYGAIIKKKTCCQGYAFAMKRILDQMGIINNVVTGNTEDGIYHMWNVVLIEDSWFFYDCTSGINTSLLDGLINDIVYKESQCPYTITYIPKKESL